MVNRAVYCENGSVPQALYQKTCQAEWPAAARAVVNHSDSVDRVDGGELALVAVAGFAASFVDGALGMGFGPTSSSILLGQGYSPAVVSTTVNLAKVDDRARRRGLALALQQHRSPARAASRHPGMRWARSSASPCSPTSTATS